MFRLTCESRKQEITVYNVMAIHDPPLKIKFVFDWKTLKGLHYGFYFIFHLQLQGLGTKVYHNFLTNSFSIL